MRKMFKTTIAIAALASFTLAGCGQNASTATAPSSQAATQQADTGASTNTAAKDTKATDTSQKAQNVYLVVEPGQKLGPDGKKHDAFINGDFTVTVGQPVNLTILNYDDGTHTLTAKDLGLDVKISGSVKKGQAATTTATFTPTKTGTFNWQCMDKCDGDNNEWAMGNDGYMQGKITVSDEKVQHVSMVINPDYKLGPDGKLHDGYTPGDITVNANEPVELTIYNFGKKGHHFSSPELGADIPVTGSTGNGDPKVFKTTFTPTKTGKFQWHCLDACDGSNGNFSMANDNYMTGFITVQ